MNRLRGCGRPVSRVVGLSTLRDPDTLSVDTLATCAPGMEGWRELCPFHVWPSADITVPGSPELRSRSVEAVWQGLKVVDEQLDLAQLDGTPHKRPPDDQRGENYSYAASTFKFGGRLVDLITARYLLYLPTYVQVLEILADQAIITIVEDWLNSGRDVAFYDWDANFDINDPSSSFSHSSLLAHWFNGTLAPFLNHTERLMVPFDVPAVVPSPSGM